MNPSEQIKAFLTAKPAAPSQENKPPAENPETAPKRLSPAELAVATREAVARFIKDIIVPEPGALCAFHYMLARYRKYASDRYRETQTFADLCAAALDQTALARALVAHGITADFDRQLFRDVYCYRQA